MFRKSGCIFLVFLLTGLLAWAGCQRKDTKQEKKKIVCTIFPVYDWVKEILGEVADRYDVILLTDHGVDLHSYQPNAEDIANMATCDVLIYVGGESDKWVTETMRVKQNENMQVIALMETLGEYTKEEEIIEGMDVKEEKDSQEKEYDEHVWLSLKMVQRILPYISEALQETDPENASILKVNTEHYIEKLALLDTAYQDTVNQASNTTLIFGDRFPFRYMADDYGLKYYAAFLGCAAESEASFDTIVFLSQKVDELDIHNVFVLERSDHKIAEQIIENTHNKNQNILALHSMQSISRKELEGGIGYVDIMEENLKVLRTAFQN